MLYTVFAGSLITIIILNTKFYFYVYMIVNRTPLGFDSLTTSTMSKRLKSIFIGITLFIHRKKPECRIEAHSEA